MTYINTLPSFLQHKKLLSSIGLILGLTVGIPQYSTEAKPSKIQSEAESIDSFEVSPKERGEIRKAFEGSQFQLMSDTYQMMRYSRRKLEKILSPKLLSSLKKLGETGLPNLIKIKGLPVDNIPREMMLKRKVL